MALRLRGATSGYIELKAPASAGDNTLTLPTNNGSANQLLKTDGSGNLSWVDDNSGVSLSGSTNNTIATVTGANALIGEANLTFDGSTLKLKADNGEFVVKNASNTDAISVDSDNGNTYIAGNVGIGTTSLSTKLSLEGSAGSTSHGILIGAKNAGGIRGVIEVHTAADTTGFNLSRTGGGSDTDIVLLKNDGDIGVVECRNSSNTSKVRLKAGALSYLYSEDSRGHQELLELKHINTTTTGDGPALLFNGYYSNAEWKYAKISSENSGSGYGAKFKISVHPADSTQASNLVEALNIVGDGAGANVTITDGNLKIGTDGHGIDFSASVGTNATSSILDDYEVGTWTPYYISTNGTFGYTTQNGWYCKVGKLVTVRAYIRTSSVSSTSHSLVKVAGLPFQVDSRTPGSIRCNGFQGTSWDDFPSAFSFENNQTFGELQRFASGGNTDFTTSTMNNDTSVYLAGTYKID